MTERFDAVVVGGGFGGLGAALRLAELGRRVVLLERLDYLGGCACTFEHEGDRFEGGATLFAGFERGQLFERWIREHDVDVSIDRLDVPVELRAGEGPALRARRDRASFLAEFEALPGAPVAELRRFFRLQERVASVLWELFEDPRLLPPLGLVSALRHVPRLPRYLPLLGLVGRPLARVLERYDLAGYAPLVHWLDAQCQITVQCSAREAEAPFALAALDYHHRGAAHVRGGIGALAAGLGRALERAGGRVVHKARASRVERHQDRWRVTARGRTYEAPAVVMNLLPQVARALIAGARARSLTRLDELAATVREGWGACALFRIVRPPSSAGPRPGHLELVDDTSQPFVEGNHVFLSVGAEREGVADPRTRRATISTHVDLARLRALEADDQRRHIEAVQARMRATLARRAPEWEDVVRELPASPRTYARWTGRDESDGLGGWAGGVPRRAGLRAYRGLQQRELEPGLALVGDTLFPGQSTLATALGGANTAERLHRWLGRARSER